MEEKVLLWHLDRLERLIEKDDLYYARRYNKREIENLKGITEQKCKMHKTNKGFCRTCKNITCNLNSNEKMKKEEWNMSSKEIIDDEKKKEMYAKNYSKIFNMEILKSDFSKLPMLSYILEIFNNELEEMTPEIKKLNNEAYEFYEEIEKELTDEQKEKMQEYREMLSDIGHKEKEKTFIMGYLIGLKLSQELKTN